MAKKKKYPYKYVRPEQLDEYKSMGRESLIQTLINKNGDLETAVNAKKNSDYLKDLAKDIADFRKNKSSNELLELEESLKKEKEVRDSGIQDIIDEKKDLEAGMNDSIKANKEHVKVLLSVLAKTK